MRIKEFLENVCQQIKYQPIRKEVSEELENHLLEAKESYILEGVEEAKAEEKAIIQMGNAAEIGKKLNKIHCPKLDWKLLFLALILIIFGGLVTLTRANNCWDDKGVFPYSASIAQYRITLLVGVILSMICYFFDYRKIVKFPKWLYGIATILLIVTINVGVQINGANIYISILGFTIYTPMIAVPLYFLAFIGFVQKIDKNKNLKIQFLK